MVWVNSFFVALATNKQQQVLVDAAPRVLPSVLVFIGSHDYSNGLSQKLSKSKVCCAIVVFITRQVKNNDFMISVCKD